MIIIISSDIYKRIALYLIFIITIATHSIILMPDNTIGKDGILVPCYHSVMNSEEISNYYSAINIKLLVNRSEIDNVSGIVQILKLSTKDGESVLSLYKDINGKHILKQIEADNNIWNSLINSGTPDQIKDKIGYVAFDNIHTNVSSVEVSAELYSSLYKMLSMMINKMHSPHDNNINTGLDGVTYWYSSTPGLCGMTNVDYQGEKSSMLIDITEQLITTVDSGKKLTSLERDIINKINTLHSSLCLEDQNNFFCH